MMYDFTEEQYMLKDMVKKLAENEIKPCLEEIEAEGVPDRIWQSFVDLGLIAMPYPEEYGGIGGTILDACILCEELAKVDGNSAMLATAHELGSHPIIISASHEQKLKYLPQIASGEKYCCFGLTEADAGSDVAGMKTKAVDMGDYYLVNGTKRFITHAPSSGLMSLFAKTDPSKGVKGPASPLVSTKTNAASAA